MTTPAGDDPHSLSDGGDVRVTRAVEEYQAAARAGRPPDRTAFLARHADVAGELAACLDGLALIESAAPRLGDLGGGTLPDLTHLPAEEPVGDFRLVRELGRGGMGVVYEAEQLSLGRRVALKVLPFAAALDPRQLRRFRNEALAAAHLTHPHIVPVYGVGCERGVHYYAMQLIEGRSLADLVRGMRVTAGFDPDGPVGRTGPVLAPDTQPIRAAALSTERSQRSPAHVRAVAALGGDAAEALEHAHRMGVVHRDIKPANLMLDGRGHLWVADFGLAQVRGGPDLTRTGDLVGTLRYMAPEQAAAKHDLVDHRADVYSLGVTLYELLTLTPAVVGRDRGEVLKRLLDGDRPNPRRLNPAVPADLETVLLKATAREPGDRYATAQEFADDLRRFLADRPVAARRPGLARRAGKWVHRHRPLVVAAGASLVLAVVGLTVGLCHVAAERAEAARQRDHARRAVDDMYTGVAERWLDQEPGLEEVQREFLLKALAYYQEFARGEGRHPEARLGMAQAQRRVGDIQARLENYPAAERAYAETARLYSELAAADPARREYREGLAGCHEAVGRMLARVKRQPEAAAAYRRAIDLRERLLDGADNPARSRCELGAAVGELGRLAHAAGRRREAEAHLGRAITLLADRPGGADGANYEDCLGSALGQLAEMRGGRDELGEAREFLGRAITHRRAALAARPRHPAYRRMLAESLARLAAVEARLGDGDAAERAYREALDVQTRLADDFPLTPWYRGGLARTHADLADLYHTAGRGREAAEAYRRAAGQWDRLVRDFPNSPGHARDLAWLLATCPEGSVRDPDRAVEAARKAVAIAPEGGDCRRALGAALLRAGDDRGAVAELGRAVTLRAGGDGREWFLLALAHARLGDRGEARRLFDRGVGWLGERRDDATLCGLRAEAAAALAGQVGQEK